MTKMKQVKVLIFFLKLSGLLGGGKATVFLGQSRGVNDGSFTSEGGPELL